MKILARISKVTVTAAILAAALSITPSPGSASTASPAIQNTACDASNSFQYFTFYVAGNPVCYTDSGTMTMHLAPVGLWYAENNYGTFTYILPDRCPPPVVFGRNESGSLPPDAIIISLTIY
ncbi:hypothetical protein [Fodinicola feengrottensis]|uniref:hypothetical protein n=2 Tax=Fodinicola feengrottensis TaxID=435914 RepID=UPI0013D15939|nr:hypothetical protein [Fodinicola feengrottensis]